MKSKTSSYKKYIFIALFLFVIIAVLVARFKINLIEFEGDTTYLNFQDSRISGLVLLKNKNLLISDKNDFITKLKEINPEISSVEIYPKNFSLVKIKIKNQGICCVLKDKNTNKFLVSLDGKIIKSLSRDTNYPNEISLNQEIDLNSKFTIESLKKIVEIENVLLDKRLEVSEIELDNDKIVFELGDHQTVIIDSQINTKNFIEKLTTMIDYFKQKNLSYKKMDFRFGNVVVE